eukprot:282831_1
MSVSDPTTSYYRTVYSTIYAITAFAVLIILFIELRTFYYSINYQNNITAMSNSSSENSNLPPTTKHHQSKPKVKKLTFILPILAYIFYIIAGLCGVLCILGIKPCEAFAIAGPSAYIIAKMLMYSVFIYRIYVVYSDSVFGYNTRLLIAFNVIVCIYSTIITFVNAFTMDISIYYNANHKRVCRAAGTKLVGFLGIFCDTVVSCLCCYLFIKPLLILNKRKHHQRTCSIQQLIVKYFILSFIAVFTTALSMIAFIIFGISAFLVADIVTNSICVLLMNKYYELYYQRICCVPIRLANKLCISSQNHQNKSNSNIDL